MAQPTIASSTTTAATMSLVRDVCICGSCDGCLARLGKGGVHVILLAPVGIVNLPEPQPFESRRPARSGSLWSGLTGVREGKDAAGGNIGQPAAWPRYRRSFCCSAEMREGGRRRVAEAGNEAGRKLDDRECTTGAGPNITPTH